MTRRLFYIALGATVGVLVVRRATAAAHSLTPAGLQERASGGIAGLTDAIRDFTTEIRIAMAEREDELRTALGLDGSADVIDVHTQER